ncbi:Hypothetical protein A7982_01450 [Minicystis rosea]|nr:Hypothetical protein A7982_01450 [Minicystis rosea]
MDYAAFQDAVIEIAEDGTRLTKAAVAAHLAIEPARAGELLDRMCREGGLELDIDEQTGEIFYTPSTRRPPAPSRASRPTSKKGGLATLRDLESALEKGGLAAKVGTAIVLGSKEKLPPERRRKLALGMVLGGLFPGFGLAYAAPWPVVVVASAIVVVGVKVLSLIPFLSSFFLVPFLVVCALTSAVLGGMYAWTYNQEGKRAPLGDEPVSPRALLDRIRKP